MSTSSTLRPRFREYIRHQRLIGKSERILAAVSGGVDSVALLDLLAQEQGLLNIDIGVAHVNHQLRGSESDEDEQFVEGRARHYGLPFFSEHADTAGYARAGKRGIQEAARDQRYRFFDTCVRNHGFTRVATAHTANDNAETILLNMFRGAGVSGLSGIPPFNKQQNTIRPLLFARRHEVEEYAAQENLPFRIDSSNAKDTYTRNFIRHNVLPAIQERVNPNIIGTLTQSAALFGELDSYLVAAARQSAEHVIHQADGTTVEISIQAMNALPTIIRQYTIMLATERLMGTCLEYRHVQSILALSDGDTGSRIPLGNDCHAIRDREKIVFQRGKSTPEFRISIQPDREYEFPSFHFSTTSMAGNRPVFHNRRDVEYIDAGTIQNRNLVLRTWRDGDAFVPLGMSGKKKVSDFLIDEKVPVFEKKSIPILVTEEDEIVWLCGRRIDDRFKINDDTHTILKLEFRRHADEEDRQG